MKTHDLAKQLRILTRLLINAPNVELSEFDFTVSRLPKRKKGAEDKTDLLAMLVNLQSIGKAELVEFVELYDLPIGLRPRDAARDVLAKLLKYLQDNPEARKKIKSTNLNSTKASPELLSVLSKLVN